MPGKVIATYTLEEAFKLLDTTKSEIVLHGYKVKTHNQRYTLFKANPTCVMCGSEGKWMKLHKTSQDRAHFNLWTCEPNCRMLTKDHIMPRSRGGPDLMWNYQSMCNVCNTGKKNGYPVSSRFFNPHDIYTEKEKLQEEWLARRFGARYEE